MRSPNRDPNSPDAVLHALERLADGVARLAERTDKLLARLPLPHGAIERRATQPPEWTSAGGVREAIDNADRILRMIEDDVSRIVARIDAIGNDAHSRADFKDHLRPAPRRR